MLPEKRKKKLGDQTKRYSRKRKERRYKYAR